MIESLNTNQKKLSYRVRLFGLFSVGGVEGASSACLETLPFWKRVFCSASLDEWPGRFTEDEQFELELEAGIRRFIPEHELVAHRSVSNTKLFAVFIICVLTGTSSGFLLVRYGWRSVLYITGFWGLICLVACLRLPFKRFFGGPFPSWAVDRGAKFYYGAEVVFAFFFEALLKNHDREDALPGGRIENNPLVRVALFFGFVTTATLFFSAVHDFRHEFPLWRVVFLVVQFFRVCVFIGPVGARASGEALALVEPTDDDEEDRLEPEFSDDRLWVNQRRRARRRVG